MQPYSYLSYPNAAAAPIPIPYVTPIVYPSTTSYANPVYDPYAQVPPVVYPVGYGPQVVGYQPAPMSSYIPVVQAVHPQPQQIDRRQFQHPPAYHYNSNGVNPAATSRSKATKTASKKALTKSNENGDTSQNALIQSLPRSSKMDALLKQKETKIGMSKSYVVKTKKPDFQDGSDNEFDKITIDSPRPATLKQPRTARIERPVSSASSCSHCSTCTNCSCSDCRHPNERIRFDDCPECRKERENEKIPSRRDQRN